MAWESEDEEFREMLEVVRWSCSAINRYWRVIYGNGIWLTRAQAEGLVRDGWAFTAPRLLNVIYLFGLVRIDIEREAAYLGWLRYSGFAHGTTRHLGVPSPT